MFCIDLYGDGDTMLVRTYDNKTAVPVHLHFTLDQLHVIIAATPSNRASCIEIVQPHPDIYTPSPTDPVDVGVGVGADSSDTGTYIF